MPTTSRGYRYPSSSDDVRPYEDIQFLADDINNDVTSLLTWTSYTPQWTASTTNPSIGNGTISGKYRYASLQVIELAVIIRPGSTTTFGSGQYRISLPVTAPAGAPDPFISAIGLHGGALYEYIGWANTVSAPATFVSMYQRNINTQVNVGSWTNASPVAFANGHSFTMFGSYFVTW